VEVQARSDILKEAASVWRFSQPQWGSPAFRRRESVFFGLTEFGNGTGMIYVISTP